jgi:hypothetical protein
VLETRLNQPRLAENTPELPHAIGASACVVAARLGLKTSNARSSHEHWELRRNNSLSSSPAHFFDPPSSPSLHLAISFTVASRGSPSLLSLSFVRSRRVSSSPEERRPASSSQRSPPSPQPLASLFSPSPPRSSVALSLWLLPSTQTNSRGTCMPLPLPGSPTQCLSLTAPGKATPPSTETSASQISPSWPRSTQPSGLRTRPSRPPSRRGPITAAWAAAPGTPRPRPFITMIGSTMRRLLSGERISVLGWWSCIRRLE